MTIASRTAHQNPSSIKEVMANINKDQGPIVLVTGQFQPESGGTIRLGVFHETHCLKDCWFPANQLSALHQEVQKINPVRRGEWDVMYATGWSHYWTHDHQDFLLVDQKGVLLNQEGDRLIFGRQGKTISQNQIASIEVYLSDDWVFRGVQLHLQQNQTILVAEEEDPIALIDPCFDRFNISFEANWAVSLGRALEKNLKIPIKIHEELL